MQLQGGDDYLLLFTLPEGEAVPAGCHVIGQVETQPGIRLRTMGGQIQPLSAAGWQHF